MISRNYGIAHATCTFLAINDRFGQIPRFFLRFRYQGRLRALPDGSAALPGAILE